MDYLGSPWRYKYIAEHAKAERCIFCDYPNRGDDHEALIVYRTQFSFVILNRYPYTSGHVMVVPYNHVGSLEQLPEQAAADLFRLTVAAEKLLRQVYRAPGFNIGMNIGAVAGAGVAGHVHMHVVPRWPGDSNFMTTIGETRVLPEDLQDTYAKLAAAFGGVK